MGSAPDSIKILIEHFDRQADRVRSLDYNETQLRVDFINPLFAALGWDMDNRQRFAEQYREVVHEDRVKVAGQTKAPDYSFRVGGTRKFFLEAKKPSVNIKTDVEPAYQLRRYGWSAKLAVSLLTDFEEFAVYDCRIAPKHLEKASTARREYITHHEYVDRWDFLEGTFSKRAVLQGDFDRYCETAKGRGRQEFDDTFLEEIEEWRTGLASNLARRNESLNEGGINFAVQRIIDRIIFLRMAEDRGTEVTGQLQALMSGENTYARLQTIFRAADARYNSGLFHFETEKERDETPDTLTPGLGIDDKTLKDILRRLYYPQSPYEFTVVSADILGSVYERFLGKVITLTAGHRAKIEEKPEVRKAGGVYYTPTYIVDYIVNNTVGKLLEGKTPKESSKLKVLDPACGSGSFLIGAYQHLLDWHLRYYLANQPEKFATAKNAVVRPDSTGGYRLTISERKRILLDNIHGVDLDGAAVEVTKLNLLLKCLEGETSETLGFGQRLFRQRALPDLGHNILCGNSLIGTEIMTSDAWNELSEEEKRRVNPFDFERAFAAVFKQGGFDAVIGNPPYLYSAFQGTEAWFDKRFRWIEYQTDIYALFVERAIELSKNHGLICMIVSDSWVKGEKFSKMRGDLLTAYELIRVVTFGYRVFRDAVIENSIIEVEKSAASSKHFASLRVLSPASFGGDLRCAKSVAVARGLIDVFADENSQAVVRQMERSSMSLSNAFLVNRGIHAYRTDGYGQSKFASGSQTARDKKERSYHSRSKENATYLKEFKGKDIFRYDCKWGGDWVSYGPWLAEPRDPRYFSGPRVAVRKILGTRLSGMYFNKPCVLDQSLYVIVRKEGAVLSVKAVLGILLSSVGAWYLRTKHSIYDTLYPWYTTKHLSTFPLPEQADLVDPLVGRILELQIAVGTEQHPQRREQLQREIDATDRRIDELVYELYGLTAEEIRIVEEATR